MRLFQRITAFGLCAVLALGIQPVYDTKAGEEKSKMTFDCKEGESVTYYALDNSGSTVNDLLSEQWALKNDGSFSIDTNSNRFDIYDDPFGSPYSPGLRSNPLDDSFFDNIFGGDIWNGYFGGGSSGWGFFSKFSLWDRYADTGRKTATAGIDINIDDAWELYNANKSNKEVIVAVIDTGIDYSHEDLTESVWVNEDEIPDNGIDDDKNGYIDDVHGWNFYDNNNVVYTGRNDDHGTHCAGTIAAQSDNGKGIASVTSGKNVKVMVLKALGGSEGTGETLDVIQAIKYAEANGASIVNLSLGSSYSDELLYNTIAQSKMLFVVASGNGSYMSGRGSNTDKSPCYPASYDLDNIISVANISYDGTLDSSSNYGEKSVDIAAPGTDIISTTPKNNYGYMTGTSMAAPFVTAAAALVYSYYDGITLSDVKTILLGSAKKLDSLKGKMVSEGMLDVGAALSYNTSSLSHKNFNTQKTSGKAPVLSYSAYKQNNRINLTITVNDEDNDIYALFYLVGEHTAADFAMGSNGTEFTLKRGSSTSFTATEYGIYTFYALDSEGNEAVLVVELSEKSVEDRTGNKQEQPKDTQKPDKNRNNQDEGQNNDRDGNNDRNYDRNTDWNQIWDWLWDWSWNWYSGGNYRR